MVARAPAEVAGDAKPDLAIGWIRVRRQKLKHRKNHGGGTVAALQPLMGDELLLDWMQVLKCCAHRLNRNDLLTMGVSGQDRAGLHRLPAHDDRARAAIAGTAADMHPCEVETVAEEIYEARARIDLNRVSVRVHGKR